MPNGKLPSLYHGYLACLNTQDWDSLANYVAADVSYNGRVVGLAGYRQAREDEFCQIPDLRFEVSMLVADDHTVACRLDFNISPRGEFLGLPVNGRRIAFSEHVFYEYEHDKIARVSSVLDKAAIEAQLGRT